MTKTERTRLTAKLEAVIEQLHKSIAPIGGKERVCIVCEQITALRVIIGDLKGGDYNS